MNSLKEHEKTAIEAAKLGADVLSSYFNKIKDFNVKKEAGFVTKADTESEKVIAEFLAKKTPEFSIFAEENGLIKKSEDKWIFDPLDGTTNFFHGVPHYNISIALEMDSEIVVGVVYNPVTKEMYHCTKNGGAYKNGQPIHVSKNEDISTCMLGTGFAYIRGELLDEQLAIFKRFTHLTHGLRRFGAAALDMCCVACGIYDGFYEKTLSPWDVAAGSLLIKEAGGKLSSYTGDEFSIYSKNIVASNGLIHNDMVKIIQG